MFPQVGCANIYFVANIVDVVFPIISRYKMSHLLDVQSLFSHELDVTYGETEVR